MKPSNCFFSHFIFFLLIWPQVNYSSFFYFPFCN
uniref:Uncharacterized protein n=1 Tax=Amphimedon queenslandica TaxID=400682 RepID=A0A1X7UWZ8_AMPQE